MVMCAWSTDGNVAGTQRHQTRLVTAAATRVSQMSGERATGQFGNVGEG
jgi:hypothetical protein